MTKAIGSSRKNLSGRRPALATGLTGTVRWVHEDRDIALRRARRLLDQRVRPAIYSGAVPLDLAAFVVPGEPCSLAEAMAAEFEPFTVGAPWGRPWGTTWFRVTGSVPEALAGRRLEAVIDLFGRSVEPGFSAEATVWREGEPHHGLHPMRPWSPVDASAAGEPVELLVEAASNPLIGYRSPMGDRSTAPDRPIYRFNRADLAAFDAEVWQLAVELELVLDLAGPLDPRGPLSATLVAAVGRACDQVDPRDVAATAGSARKALATVLGRPAAASAHRLSAIGHAHIDAAWLWPVRETRRKCERTFSSALRHMDDDAGYIFGASQAAQYRWIAERHPRMFGQIADRVAGGQWVPLGGMWVEPDMNVAGGEAMARQLLHGQRFFRDHFGVTARVGWQPDVFGYPASMPQLCVLGGLEAFVTQKLSWNRTNVMPHHTFDWVGIDGTAILTHFPPVDTYNSDVTPTELVHAERNFRDGAWSSGSILPFGYGDGGGGPTREMLAHARLAADQEGLPRVTLESPSAFVDVVRAEGGERPTWVGELYLETHRGTYTSQAQTKAGNRRGEIALREAEWWSVAAGMPTTDLAEAWRDLLLLQFHDILPGSSIAWVHREAEADHARITATAESVTEAALGRLAGDGDELLLANAAPHHRAEVVLVEGPAEGQVVADGRVAVWAELGAGAVAPAGPVPDHLVPVTTGPDWIDNGLVRLAWDADGLWTSVLHLEHNREVLRAGQRGNVLELLDDLPVEYDAWDIEEYGRRRRQELTAVDQIDLLDAGPHVARLRVTRSHGPSRFAQTVVVRAGSRRIDVECDIDWHADEELLKVAFPVDVHADRVAAEIQFGHCFRPTHRNTSWDAVRFEQCAHRWVDLSEPGYGVALLNTAKYGYDVLDGALRLTLLKSANFPAPGADRGRHRFTYSLLPHTGDLRQGGVVEEGYRLNLPPRTVRGRAGANVAAPVRSDHPAVVVEALKHAEDGSGDWVVRCYEAWGTRDRAQLTFNAEVSDLRLCDLLEDELGVEHPGRAGTGIEQTDLRTVAIDLRPFRIATLRVTPAG